MTTWDDVVRAAPELAGRVRALFDAHRHKTLATLRADGSPRISGIESAFEDGELVLGSMPDSRKGADLRRDPRFALHSGTVDPVEGAEAQWPGEAKIAGRAVLVEALDDGAGEASAGEASAEAAGGDRFRADITEVVHTHLDDKATVLVIDWWTPSGGLRRAERG
jgi:Pyridoxamine 5'-phosphate oxidase